MLQVHWSILSCKEIINTEHPSKHKKERKVAGTFCDDKCLSVVSLLQALEPIHLSHSGEGGILPVSKQVTATFWVLLEAIA
jgi:hypothetical protein